MLTAVAADVSHPLITVYRDWMYLGKRLRRRKLLPETRRFVVMFRLAVAGADKNFASSVLCETCNEVIYKDDDLVIYISLVNQMFNICTTCAKRLGWQGSFLEDYEVAIRFSPEKKPKLLSVIEGRGKAMRYTSWSNVEDGDWNSYDREMQEEAEG